jgi:murein DD-endopeptidase MepM/ murein hydrolase activator NlpD
MRYFSSQHNYPEVSSAMRFPGLSHLAREPHTPARSTLTSTLRSYFAPAAAALIMVASFIASAPVETAGAAPGAAPVQRASAQFLSLPFEPNGNMSILSGWYYNGGGFHGGIDYINGSYSGVRGWKTFPVIAAADGKACGNCTSRQGNAVWVEHKVGGQIYYTYYGHLASISEDIPQGSQSRTVAVKRGQFLGWAGDTGSRGMVHLHFALMNANSQPLDPYTIGKLRGSYPAPDNLLPGMGWFLGK